MQESGVDEENAERGGADWYLSRDGQQHGPLTEREISLFAEGGNFKPGDLLWTASLDGWKPAEEIFGPASTGTLQEGDAAKAEQSEAPQDDASFPIEDESEPVADEAPSQAPEPENAPDLGSMFRAPDAAQAETAQPGDPDAGPFDPEHLNAPHLDASHLEAARDAHLDEDASHLDDHLGERHPPGEDVSALAQAISGEEPPLDFKERIVSELKKFAGTGAYLWAVFVLLGLHSWLGDAPYGPGFGFYVAMTVNAFLAVQLMGLLEGFRGVQDLEHQPLITTIAYRALVFGALLFGLYILELIVFGLIGGAGLDLESLGGFFGTVALWIIVTVAMIPYFAFRAFQSALGAETMRKLLFLRR